MKKILRTILRRNIKTVDGRLYISSTLFDLLNDFVSPAGLVKVNIDNFEFIDISTIDGGVRERLGILNSRVEKAFESDAGYSPESQKKFAQLDIDHALNQQANFENEFIDSLCDPQEIKRKSRTLAVLKVVALKLHDQNYLREVFRILKERGPDIELPLSGYRLFYLKLRWYHKIGFVRGCLDGDLSLNSD